MWFLPNAVPASAVLFSGCQVGVHELARIHKPSLVHPCIPALESQRGCVRICAHTASEMQFTLTSLLHPVPPGPAFFICGSGFGLCGMPEAGEEARREIPELTLHIGCHPMSTI